MYHILQLLVHLLLMLLENNKIRRGHVITYGFQYRLLNVLVLVLDQDILYLV